MAPPLKYKPEHVEKALSIIADSGYSGLRVAAEQFGYPYEGLRRHLATSHREQYQQAVACARPEHRSGEEDVVSAALAALRPVQLPAPPKYKSALSANVGVDVVASDFHFPKADERSCNVLLRTIEELRPERLILNGDTVDLLAVSHYSKDQRHTWTLREEAEAFHKALYEAHRIGQRWGMQLIETEANHSGNGTASRWHRYLSDRIPHLYAHPKASELLDYRTWWYPSWCPIELVEDVVIADDLLITHGDIVRKHGAYSARAHAEKYHSSVMHGHTHRLGLSVDRIPARGTRPEQIRRSFEIGCMCDISPTYARSPNWHNGFAVVSSEGEHYGVELVSIVQGVATINALGRTVRG
jgi:hypothetical protein